MMYVAFKRTILLAGLLAATGARAAPEFTVDFQPVDGAGTRVWLSYLADSNVTALDFTVRLDLPQPTYTDARGCLTSLPKTHRGVCVARNGVLRGVIYSPTNAVLADTNLGTVVLSPGSLLKSGGAPIGIDSVNVTTVTPQGITVNAEVRITGLTSPSK